MPKAAQYVLAWSGAAAAYELRDGGTMRVVDATDAWTRWLEEHRSFSFQGRTGRLNLLKEERKGGTGYWYAYRRQGARTVKRYAGRSGEITFARLEDLARALGDNGAAETVVPQPPNGVSAELSGAEFHAPEPLLAPKLQPPRLHRTLIRRGRLLALLDAGRESKLTLISAPAGFGKTTLVRQWLAEAMEHGSAPVVAWLSLDRGDNDPLRFWRYLIAACRAFDPAVGAQSLALMESPLATRSPLGMILAAFVNELAQARRAGVLVLEDYHVITTPQIHETVGFLLDHLPPGPRLVLTTRTQPPLPLARLRAAGDLVEIAAPELRFSGDETGMFLRQATALALPPADIAQVESHIEGWAAGLRLLALALEGRQDADAIGRILENFIAGRREIGDYFVGEVLNHQPAPLQLFVLQTSFLGRLTASLCDSVTGRNNSAAMLELLERANLFLEPLDGSGLWYRYHALFAAAMQAEARRRLGEAAVRDLLARAGRWYEEHALPEEAIEAALAADNTLRAADLIEGIAGRQFSFEQPEMHGPPEFYTLQRWLSRLPGSLVAARPLLNLALAAAMLFTYIVEMRPLTGSVSSEITRLLAAAERGFQAAGDGEHLGQVFAFRALMLREWGAIAAAVTAARAALDLLPPQELNWRSVCVGTLGTGDATAGRLDSAAARFAEARAMCEALGNDAFARANGGMLSWVYVEQNDLHRAAAMFRQMLAAAQVVNDLDDVSHALHGLAEIALCWNDLDAAQVQAQEVVELTRHVAHETYHVYAALILARVEQARGDSDAALARCAALLAARGPAHLPAQRQLNARIALEQARIALAAGDRAAAQRWRASRPGDLEWSRTEQDREAILLARLLLAEGDPGGAVGLLEPLLPMAEADGRGRVALEIGVLLALIYAAEGHAPPARQMLAAALAAARPANALHVFVAEGEPLAALLGATLPILVDRPLVAFARTIRHAAGSTSPALPADAEPLTEQERRVLRLIAAGRSNPDIAADLIISVNTVKVHVKNIYRKLNVGSRLEAASAARELGLL